MRSSVTFGLFASTSFEENDQRPVASLAACLRQQQNIANAQVDEAGGAQYANKGAHQHMDGPAL